MLLRLDELDQQVDRSFNIRSFGSWIASFSRTYASRQMFKFQYPLFRIVDCFLPPLPTSHSAIIVSISALSDRGLLLPKVPIVPPLPARFNIRSFGSWIASWSAQSRSELRSLDQCFNIRSFGSWIASLSVSGPAQGERVFQYPLFRIVDCFIRPLVVFECRASVSISALSDRGLLHSSPGCFRVPC